MESIKMYGYRPGFRQVSIRLLIEAAPTGVTTCKTCNKKIGEGEARVSFHRRCASTVVFHLYCFTPVVRVRVNLADLKVVGTEIQEEVEEWVRDWNKQFELKGKDVEMMTVKRVKTEAGRKKRILLEAFKFLDHITLIHLVTPICREWYHVSWEDELWREFMHQVGFRGQGSRQEFLTIWMTSCAHCNTPLASEKRYMVCPLTYRPKCKRCFSNELYRPIRLSWARTEYSITPSMLKTLQVPVFLYDDQSCFYLYQARDKVISLRRNHIQLVKSVLLQSADPVFDPDLLDVYAKLSDENILKLRRFMYRQSENEEQVLDFVFRCKKMTNFPKLLAKLGKK